MKFNSSIVFACAFLNNAEYHGGHLFAAAFSHSSNNIKMQPYSGFQSTIPISMVASSNKEAGTGSAIIGYADVKSLTYRELQKTCKDRGLAASGSTADLRTRLLQDTGIYRYGEECLTTESGTDVSLNS